MPRASRGPHLYIKRRDDGGALWYIRDGDKRTSTGCSQSDVVGARAALERYLARTAKPRFGDGDPHNVGIAAVIALYAQDRAPKVARPHEVARRLGAIETYFGGMTVAEVTPSTCEAYARQRVSPAAARRELEDLQAALNHAWRSRKLAVPVPVALPPKSPARERWLTRDEAARLIAAACGWRFDTDGSVLDRAGPRNPHVARFVLLGLYTGTRHDAILSLGFRAHVGGGWADLDRGLLYRRAAGEVETNKRRPPAPLTPRLMAHLRRWAAMPMAGLYIVTYDGSRLERMKRAWGTVRANAGLDDAVTPHVLRHTCATWLMQEGVGMFEAGRFLGMTAQMVEKVYGHHHPEFLRGAAAALGHRKAHRQ
jgi:integrase